MALAISFRPKSVVRPGLDDVKPTRAIALCVITRLLCMYRGGATLVQMAWAKDPAECRLRDPSEAFAEFCDSSREVRDLSGVAAEFEAAWGDVCAGAQFREWKPDAVAARVCCGDVRIIRACGPGYTFSVRLRTMRCHTYPPLARTRRDGDGGSMADKLSDQAAVIDALRTELARVRSGAPSHGDDDDFDMELDRELDGVQKTTSPAS